MSIEVALRPATLADAAAIAGIYAPYVADTAISFEEVAPAPAAIVTRMTGAPRLPWLVAVNNGAIIGYAYASPHRSRAAYRWSTDVSAYLTPSHRGQGVGTSLYRQLLTEVRTLGYISAYAGITLPNPASVRLHERVGFTRVGVFRDVGYKHGQWREVGWWQLRLADPPDNPAEPRPWTASVR
jgi:phosphinothricin acetyltransferase